MGKKEVKTDFWVRDLLIEAGLDLEPQGSSIKELDNALKTASKSGTGNVGFPEYIGTVHDYIIVIEDKADLSKHVKYTGNIIDMETQSVKDYAINGALFYAKHLIKNTNYTKVIAFGISGNEKRHKIRPLYADETES